LEELVRAMGERKAAAKNIETPQQKQQDVGWWK